MIISQNWVKQYTTATKESRTTTSIRRKNCCTSSRKNHFMVESIIDELLFLNVVIQVVKFLRIPLVHCHFKFCASNVTGFNCKFNLKHIDVIVDESFFILTLEI